jgi:hypothetical protein
MVQPLSLYTCFYLFRYLILVFVQYHMAIGYRGCSLENVRTDTDMPNAGRAP